MVTVLDSSRNVVASYAYDEFGVLVSESGTLDQPYRFSTKRYYDGVGLNYYGYRFYSASLGRWMTRDPLGEEGGLNLYAAMGNSTLNYIDYYGLDPQKWGSVFDEGRGGGLGKKELIDYYANDWNMNRRTGYLKDWGVIRQLLDKDDKTYQDTHMCDLYARDLFKYFKETIGDEYKVYLVEQNRIEGDEWKNHWFVLVELEGVYYRYDPWNAYPNINSTYLIGAPYKPLEWEIKKPFKGIDHLYNELPPRALDTDNKVK